jgi:glutathione S-transferase
VKAQTGAAAVPATPLLWHIPLSHFNEKVRWALDWKGIPHRRKALALGYMPRAWWATGQPSLPILFLDGRAVADSTRIIGAIEERQPDPPLYPRDPEERRRALAIEDFFDEEVGHAVRTALLGPAFARDPGEAFHVLATGMPSWAETAMRAAAPAMRAFYRARHHNNDATIAASRGRVLAGLDRIEAELGPSGYLVGDRFSVADLTAAALLGILSGAVELQYRPAGPVPREIEEYRAALAGRPAMAWVGETYRRHRGRSAEVAA